MTQRDLIATAIKILGLCLVVFGLIAIWESGLRAYVAHCNLRSQISAQAPKEDTAQASWGSAISRAVIKNQRSQHLAGVCFRIVQIIAGLYLCRKGGMVLNFLAGKPTATTAEPPTPV